jgi:hypothetical protein
VTCADGSAKRFTFDQDFAAVRGMALDEMAQQVPLIRFRHLTLIPAGEITRSMLRCCSGTARGDAGRR